jgi:hypothetical protein
MKNIKEEALLWVRLGGFVVIWIAILYLTGTGLAINWEALKKLPDVVTVYVIFSLLFTKWLWRMRFLQGWLVPFPDLQGTWEGELKSTWKNPATGHGIPPMPAALVIKQSFSSISCVLFTPESDSYSTTAQINRDDDSGILRLSYNYTNRPKATLRHRSEIHDGAALLRIVSSPDRKLEGEYWTSRCTTGDMIFKFRSREMVQGFPQELNNAAGAMP